MGATAANLDTGPVTPRRQAAYATRVGALSWTSANGPPVQREEAVGRWIIHRQTPMPGRPQVWVRRQNHRLGTATPKTTAVLV